MRTEGVGGRYHMQTVSHGNKWANFVLSVYRLPETHVAACRVLDRHHCVPISYGHAWVTVCEWILCAHCPEMLCLVSEEHVARVSLCPGMTWFECCCCCPRADVV